jgi:hypothetical protein
LGPANKHESKKHDFNVVVFFT